MALPSTGRVGVGNRVCTGTGLGPWCSGGGNSVHTRPMGENGSSCADPPGSMLGGTVRVLVSSAQSGRLSGDGNRRTSSPWLLAGGRRLSTHGRWIVDHDPTQCLRAPRSSGRPAETGVRPFPGPRVILWGGSVCTPLRSDPLPLERKSFLQTRKVSHKIYSHVWPGTLRNRERYELAHR